MARCRKSEGTRRGRNSSYYVEPSFTEARLQFATLRAPRKITQVITCVDFGKMTIYLVFKGCIRGTLVTDVKIAKMTIY